VIESDGRDEETLADSIQLERQFFTPIVMTKNKVCRGLEVAGVEFSSGR